ncbi:MAG: hypothetical protein OEU86_05985 [Gammaproteobacteria bacterium]|nr:hypothetical protein [Gammaproteobacteria bacterium]
MKKIAIIIVLVIGCSFSTGYAADLLQSQTDCTEILESWANDPDSVSKRLVDECKEMMAGAGYVPDLSPAAGTASADPCTGANAAGSVNCWGPWSAVAAAAGPAANIAGASLPDNYQLRPDVSEYQPEFLTGGCEAGASCGFATVVQGLGSTAPSDQTDVQTFDLATDGSAFVVGADSGNEINSVNGMTPSYSDRPDAYENMQSVGADDGQVSAVVARVIRNDDGSIQSAADVWANGDTETGTIRSGYFAWGTAIDQGTLDALNTGSVSAQFSGVMSGDNSTAASITVNFGSSPTWSGNWSNPSYEFDAAGSVTGVNLVSDASQFSDNVGANSIVQGAILGDASQKSIAHVIDVDLSETGRIKDVGLLQEVVID